MRFLSKLLTLIGVLAGLLFLAVRVINMIYDNSMERYVTVNDEDVQPTPKPQEPDGE